MEHYKIENYEFIIRILKRTILYPEGLADCSHCCAAGCRNTYCQVAFNVLLMILAGALIAVYFHGFGDLIERKTS
ncbi:hypothetical protein CS542_06660 [Pedobacter sp. IW39]|nr:hypothetical protein CS542_06660 [Pedobacter sp. IW39]